MIAVIGAGAFGTALAICFAAAGKEVTLIGRDPDLAKDRENKRRLPGQGFPANLNVSNDLPQAAAYLLAVPAQATRTWLDDHRLPSPAPLVLCAKGLELGTLRRQSQIAEDILPGQELAVLTGPGFAQEIAAGKPTALALAGTQQLQTLLSGPTLRLYRTEDRTGAELGGALKNVVALACGIAHGAGLGESAKASLLTRGLAEMQRLGVELGAQAETFSGLSGLGDLALTAASTQSRNFRAGIDLGQDKPLDPTVTVEGIATAYAALDLAQKSDIDMPLARAVVSVLDGKMTVTEAIAALLSRPLIQEAR